MIEFQVYSRPATQGSKKLVGIYSRGQPVFKGGRPLTRIADDNPKLGEWRQQVAYAARQVFSGELITGPVELRLTFARPRPQGHLHAGRKNAGEVKASAPEFPTTKPDLTKLTRAVEDALTGVVWKDDSQIVEQHIRKVFDECFCVSVVIVEK